MFVGISDKDLLNKVESHELWIKSNKIEGVQAKFTSINLSNKNLSGRNLSGADFSGSALVNTNFENSILKGATFKDAKAIRANFTHADLSEANFGLADLTDANLSNANLTNTKFINAYLENTIFENCIHTETADFRNTIKQQQKDLLKQITSAKDSLAQALKNTDTRISENNEQSKLLRETAKRLFYLDILLLIGIPILIWNPCDWDLLSTIQYKFIALSGFLGHWSILFYTLPVLTILIIATTLLRHDQKLINEIRHFSAMKHQIELFSGLLEASQHAANSFNNPEKAAKYVEETFTMIRNKLLNVEGMEYKEDAREELDTNKTLDLLNKITDLVNKTTK